MKKHLLRTAACALILGGLASCQSDDLVNPANMTQEQLNKELEKRFDFNSYKTLPLSLSMSPLDCVRLYEVNPEENPDAEPFFSAVVNAQGKFDIDMPFAGHMMNKTVWAKGRDGVVKATLTDKGLNFIQSRTITTTGLESVFDEDGKVKTEGLCWKLKEITETYLKPGHNNDALVGDQMSDIDIVPTTDGGVEVKVAMIDNGDQFNVRMYYYYYTGEDPKEQYTTFGEFAGKFLDDKFRLFPNDDYDNDIAGKDYWMHENYNNQKNIGKSVQLKYFGTDLKQEGQDRFPKNVKIGFMLLNKENGSQWVKLTSGGVYRVEKDNQNVVTSDFSWEDASEGITTNYAAAMTINTFLDPKDYPNYSVSTDFENAKINHIVYTFEDATYTIDRDIDDVKMLAIVAGDMGDGIPELAPASGTFRGYYCFEDLYPDQDGGDYDMNDVIVSYEYYYILGDIVEPKSTGTSRKVIYFDYVLKPIHDGATYINDFHLSYNAETTVDPRAASTHKEIYKDHKSQLNKVFSGYASAIYNSKAGKYIDKSAKSDEFATGIIFSSLKNILGPESYTNNGITSIAGINPYIYCQNTGKQVHLSKFTYTGPNGGGKLEGETMEQFLLRHYLTNYQKDGKYKYCPFAIAIPNCDANKFTPTPESVPIYLAFPSFVEWVESNGVDATDWYAKPAE